MVWTLVSLTFNLFYKSVLILKIVTKDMDDFNGKFCKNGSFPVVRVLSDCLKAKRIIGTTSIEDKKTTIVKISTKTTKTTKKVETTSLASVSSMEPNITSIFDLYDEPSIFDFYDDAFFDLYDDSKKNPFDSNDPFDTDSFETKRNSTCSNLKHNSLLFFILLIKILTQ